MSQDQTAEGRENQAGEGGVPPRSPWVSGPADTTDRRSFVNGSNRLFASRFALDGLALTSSSAVCGRTSPGESVFRASAVLLIAVLLSVAMWMVCCFAPTERTMGDAQRIVYVHVAVAWLGLAAFLVMAGSGLAYLVRRDLKWDHLFQAAGELGWLTSGLTLATGSLWAHEAWGTWWEFDPRLTASFILWLIYSGILLVRGGLEDSHQRARIGAILALLGAVDIPLVIMATRWFRGMHPVSPQMEPAMRLTLLVTAVAFTALFAWLLVRRSSQLRLQAIVREIQRETCSSTFV